jgi:hypothetical protein
MVYRNGRTLDSVGVLGIAGLAAGLALGVVAYSGRLGEAPEDILRRNAAVHRCDNPACLLCEVDRDFAARHPDAGLEGAGQEIDGENAVILRFVDPAPTD